jgi:DNA replication and repair protein RecF
VYLSKLQLYHFKNHSDQSLGFCNGINTITGANGIGKTNILDAVHYLANAKSYFNGIDSQIIQHNQAFFTIKGSFEGESPADILVQFESGKKTIKKNDKAYPRLLDHIGLIQTVFITPYDIELALGGSEDRRKFIDLSLCQIDKSYLHNLSVYKKSLDQRNALLKNMQGRPIDPDLLDSFDAKLVPAGIQIHARRTDFVSKFTEFFIPIYQNLSQGSETPSIHYDSQLNEGNFSDLLHSNQRLDTLAQRTGIGIHKDDLQFGLGEFPLKKFGSQGQIKSFIIALKLAQYKYFQSITNTNPILLLDDIFEKIDENRAQRLIEMVGESGYGQIIITDTHASRVETHFSGLVAEKMHHHLTD